MKGNFTYYNPTKIYFGKGALVNLEGELAKYGKRVLLAYGGGSIKRIKLYDEVISILNKAKKEVYELPQIMPNPTYEKVLEGAKIIKDNAIDLILAVGGGSVIDCAKGIAASAYCAEDAWEKYWERQEPVTNRVVPIGTVLTMVGTGSEMNGGSVITNNAKKLKIGRVFPSELYPSFSILDPEYTYSVPKYQMLSGIFDIMSHLMEQYFSGTDDNTSDYLIEGLLECVIESSRKAVKDPLDYEARSNLMWASTMALNTIVGKGKDQDWQVHSIEHQLGAYTDCAHGMGLCAISLPYYRYICRFGLPKFKLFAEKIWHVDSFGKDDLTVALAGIDCLEKFVKEVGMVTKLSQLNATEQMLPLIAQSTAKGGGYHNLTTEEVLEILQACF